MFAGWTALHHAADAGQEEVVRFLLERGADRDKVSLDYAAHSALHFAVIKRRYEAGGERQSNPMSFWFIISIFNVSK